MLLPGYVTDLAGLLCFTPGLRSLIGQLILSRLSTTVLSSGFASRFTSSSAGPAGFSDFDTDEDHHRAQPFSRPTHPSLDGEVIEGQYESKDTTQK